MKGTSTWQYQPKSKYVACALVWQNGNQQKDYETRYVNVCMYRFETVASVICKVAYKGRKALQSNCFC